MCTTKKAQRNLLPNLIHLWLYTIVANLSEQIYQLEINRDGLINEIDIDELNEQKAWMGMGKHTSSSIVPVL
jgi:hypothetical protein